MAYGVKFRLEFSDDNEKGKKIEILKDGYVKAQPSDPDLTIYSLVGTSEPVTIEWQGDDDFYNPIIGSTCKINLFDTDDTNYDDFYAADEREYKIRISYKDDLDAYQTYWEGWLLVDQFQEAVLTKPYQITLSGYDGLGSLGGFTAPIDLTSVQQKDLMYYITNILNDINLGFDIYISNDIQKNGASGSDYTIYDQTLVGQNAFLKGGTDLRTSKDVLEQILKFTNAKIFQSFGKWYIINNSSYSEQDIKDASATTANGGTIPTGIRADETASLQDNAYEQIKYFIYNSSGVYQSTSTVDILQVLSGSKTTLTKTNCVSNCNIAVDLINIGANLTKEYLRPLKQFTMEVDTDTLFNVNRFTNGHFEHGSTLWTLTNSTIDSDFSFKGERSLKSTSVATSFASASVILQNTTATSVNFNPNIADTLKLNTYFESTSGNDKGFGWQIKIVEVGPGSSATKYWNHTTSSWTNTVTINEQEIDTNNRWLSFSYNLDSYPQENTGAWDLTLYLYSAYQTTSTSGFTALYFDSLELEYKNIDDNGTRTDIFTKFDLLQLIRKRSVDLSGVKKLDGIYLTNDKYSRISGDYYRSRDKTNYLKSIEKIVLQQVMNDYRDYVVRYEGDLYNNNTVPIAPHNKIWVNYGSSVLQEPVSCFIDGMTYNVKKNIFSVVMHVPNQDDDITSDFTIKF